MRSLGRVTLVFRAVLQRVTHVDPLDDEDFVLEVDLAFRL
jgi:hypothetical protein